jgi:hypothetical protein
MYDINPVEVVVGYWDRGPAKPLGLKVEKY